MDNSKCPEPKYLEARIIWYFFDILSTIVATILHIIMAFLSLLPYIILILIAYMLF